MRFLKENINYEKTFYELLKGVRKVRVEGNTAYLHRPLSIEHFNKFIVDEMPELEFVPYYTDDSEDAVEAFEFVER